MDVLQKPFYMENADIKTGCKGTDLLSGSQETKSSVSELDILRKAYELILENSDLFFKELGNAFMAESEPREFNPMI
jgi:hypothetical protein